MCRAEPITPDLADLLAAARRFVARILNGCPLTDTAVLLASELVTNALTHTRTAASGKFDVIIWSGDGAAYVAVIDDGSGTVPAQGRHALGELADCGRGLELVELMATQWGHYGWHDQVEPGQGRTQRTLVWFRLDWPTG